jgi:hypothetical protein
VTSSAGVSEVIRRGWEDVDKCEGIVTQEGRKKDVGGVIQPFRGDSHHIKARRQDRCPSLRFSIIEIADRLHNMISEILKLHLNRA